MSTIKDKSKFDTLIPYIREIEMIDDENIAHIEILLPYDLKINRNNIISYLKEGYAIKIIIGEPVYLAGYLTDRDVAQYLWDRVNGFKAS